MKELNLAIFSSLNNLNSLELVQTKVCSLNGIQFVTKLKCLTIFYDSELLSLDEISNQKELEYIEFHSCKNKNYEG